MRNWYLPLITLKEAGIKFRQIWGVLNDQPIELHILLKI